jgi:hypothetical protein
MYNGTIYQHNIRSPAVKFNMVRFHDLQKIYSAVVAPPQFKAGLRRGVGSQFVTKNRK